MSEGDQDSGGGLRARFFRRWGSRQASEREPEPAAAEATAETTATPDPTEREQPPEQSGPTEMPAPAAAPPPADLPELALDVAALWLAFGQHERVLRDLTSEIERLGGRRIMAPGGREAEAPGTGAESTSAAPAGAPLPGPPTDVAPSGDAIGDQLADLDGILEAIESATKVLGVTHSEELSRGEEEPDAADGDDSDDERRQTASEGEPAEDA